MSTARGSPTGNTGLVEKAAIPRIPELVARLNTGPRRPQALKDLSVFQLIPGTDALKSLGVLSTHMSVPVRPFFAILQMKEKESQNLVQGHIATKWLTLITAALCSLPGGKQFLGSSSS